MTEHSAPEKVVLALVRVINGESPRSSAREYLDPDVKIHMDFAAYRGITIWFKWIYLIRNCGRIRNLRMTPCSVSGSPQDSSLVRLSIRWSGINRSTGVSASTPEKYDLLYKVQDGRISEIWTKKINYTFIFGSWIRHRLLYRLFFLWAVLLFARLSLLGRGYLADKDQSANLWTQKKSFKSQTWERVVRKWTFVLFHFFCLLYLLSGHVDVVGSLSVWFVMQMGVHTGYHRYFSHNSFRTYPWFEFLLGCAGCLAFQRGPIWWAATHRSHHHHADTDGDLHSPTKGFWFSHMGWFWLEEADNIDCRLVPDLLRPVPVWIERRQEWIHGIYISSVYLVGGYAALLAWWIVPIVLCWHSTFATNSFCHTIGSHPYPCHPRGFCMARNNFLVAIVNLGEGWHSNHHANPSWSNHGFYRWYQLDIVYIVLWVLEKLRIVWAVRKGNMPTT
jgi:stearoyl-CoA desaturase (Delta-9 desaturase)